jgi:hypothetical protein
MQRIKILAAIIILSIVVAGCGRKTQPVPPGTIRPKAITDLSYRITQKGAELTWTVPVRNRDGTPIYYINSFQLFRAETPVNESCPGCPPRFEVPIKIPYDARPEEAKKMVYEDRTLKTGIFYTYEVRTVRGWLSASDPSNRVSFAWHIPPAPPENVATETMPDTVRIYWGHPDSWSDGSHLDKEIAYRVYRTRFDEKDWKDISGPIKSNEFLDKKLKHGLRFQYMVKSVLDYHGTEIISEPAGLAEAFPRDVLPPSPPSGLVAVAGKQVVELLWQENAETDLAGYFIYRRDKRGLIDRINKEPVPIPRFPDRTGLAPGKYTYWVTAADRTGNESPPSKSVSVEIY